MNFKIFIYYVEVCSMLNCAPSFTGLEKFKDFYIWEMSGYGRCKMGKNRGRHV